MKEEKFPKRVLLKKKKATEIAKLRPEFLAAVDEYMKSMEPLERAIRELLAQGTSPEELLEWGIEAGESEEFVRATINAVQPNALPRKRRLPKPGKKIPPRPKDN